MFGAILKSYYAEKNNIPTGSIPDVKEEKFAQDKAIYMFYRAGILSGVDSKGTFKPQDNIKYLAVSSGVVLVSCFNHQRTASAKLPVR